MERKWLATTLLALSLALAARYEDGPYTGLPWLTPDAVGRGVLPYVTVYRIDRWRKAVKHQKDDSDSPPPRYEWHLPASTLEGTRAVSRDLLLAWQRLEERTYWHTLTRIHYQIGVTEALCASKRAFWPAIKPLYRLNPPKPKPTTGTPPSAFPEGYRPPLRLRSANAEGKLRLDWYTYYLTGMARVPPDDYCDDIGPNAGNLPFFPLFPGVKVITAIGTFATPGYPKPLWVGMDEFQLRARKGMLHAENNYIPDYTKQALQAVAPRGEVTSFLEFLQSYLKSLSSGGADDAPLTRLPSEPEVYLPTAWSGPVPGVGSTVTPTIRFVPSEDVINDIRAIIDTLFTKADFADDRLDLARYAYYVPALKKLTDLLGLPLPLPDIPDEAKRLLDMVLVGDKYRDDVARGVWPLEELKRWLPPSLPQVHEVLGYTTYHQVFSRIDATPLPDPGQKWEPGEYPMVAFMRSLHVIHVPVIVDARGVPYEPPIIYPDVANVRPIFIAPYVIFYSGPRYYWDWVSIPDAYPIPRVVGTPTPVIPLPKR